MLTNWKELKTFTRDYIYYISFIFYKNILGCFKTNCTARTVSFADGRQLFKPWKQLIFSSVDTDCCRFYVTVRTNDRQTRKFAGFLHVTSMHEFPRIACQTIYYLPFLLKGKNVAVPTLFSYWLAQVIEQLISNKVQA